jgi:uncharacterized membrane protein YdjX (TVP38/TMEM64 family)
MLMDSVTNFIKTLRHNKTFQIIMVVLVLAAGAVLMINFNFSVATAFLRANRSQAILIGIGIYFLLGFTLIPTAPLTLSLAVLLGPWEAVLTAATGNSLAAVGEYYVGVIFGDIFDFEEKKHKLPFGLADLPITSPYVLMAGRLLPLGKQGFSIVCGAYRVSMGKYLWTSIVMYTLNAAFLAFTGMGLVRLFQNIFLQ